MSFGLSRMLLVDPCANPLAFGAWTLGSSAFGGTISTRKTTEANRKPWRIRLFVRGMISGSLFGSGTEWSWQKNRNQMQLEVGCIRAVTTSDCTSCRSFMSHHTPSSLLRWSHLADRQCWWHMDSESGGLKSTAINSSTATPRATQPLRRRATAVLQTSRAAAAWMRSWNREMTDFHENASAFSDRQARRSKEHHVKSKIFITRQHLTCCWYVFSVFIDIQARLPGHGLLGWRPPLWKRDGRYQGTVSLREGKHIQNQSKNLETACRWVKFPEGMVAQASQRRRLSRTRLRSELSRCGAGANVPNGKQFSRIQELDFESFDVQTCSRQHFTSLWQAAMDFALSQNLRLFMAPEAWEKLFWSSLFWGLCQEQMDKELCTLQGPKIFKFNKHGNASLERWLADKADSLQNCSSWHHDFSHCFHCTCFFTCSFAAQYQCTHRMVQSGPSLQPSTVPPRHLSHLPPLRASPLKMYLHVSTCIYKL